MGWANAEGVASILDACYAAAGLILGTCITLAVVRMLKRSAD